MAVRRHMAKKVARNGRLRPAGQADHYSSVRVEPDFPVKPRVDSATGLRFTILCLQQEDGRYVAEILQHPEIRHVGRTRHQAELVVSKMFLECRQASRDAHHNAMEDRLWLELARANRETSGISIDEYRKRRGL